METQYFGQFLEERLKDKGISLKKLSEASGISSKHLEALRNDDFASLPPAPYIHGYVKKLGMLFGFDAEEWWQRIKISELKLHTKKDAPPKSDFVKPPIQKGVLMTILILVLGVSLLGFAAPKIFGKPGITMQYPIENPAITADKNITLQGTVKNGSDLYINGESTEINKDGLWEKTIVLETGINSVEIKAKKFLGGETKVLEQIIYQAPNTSLAPDFSPTGI